MATALAFLLNRNHRGPRSMFPQPSIVMLGVVVLALLGRAEAASGLVLLGVSAAKAGGGGTQVQELREQAPPGEGEPRAVGWSIGDACAALAFAGTASGPGGVVARGAPVSGFCEARWVSAAARAPPRA